MRGGRRWTKGDVEPPVAEDRVRLVIVCGWRRAVAAAERMGLACSLHADLKHCLLAKRCAACVELSQLQG